MADIEKINVIVSITTTNGARYDGELTAFPGTTTVDQRWLDHISRWIERAVHRKMRELNGEQADG